jgi:SAM-dependent methyltransferase
LTPRPWLLKDAVMAPTQQPSAAPLVFDRALVARRRDRARREGYADFLVAHVAGELQERLLAAARDFPLALDLGSPTAHAAMALRASGKSGFVVRAAPPEGGAGDLIADEEALPFAGGRLDLIASVLALHSVNDLPGALIQIRRALKPDGLFIACLLGGDTLNELRTAFAAAEAEMEGGASPRVAPFGDVRDLGGLMQRAGFALPVVDSDRLIVRYAEPFALMRDLRAMGLTNALVARSRKPLRRGTLLRMAQIYVERFAQGDGRIPATFELVWLSGWAPHESQQKPLRPGSAKARLADALKAVEHKLPGGPDE